MTDIKEFVKNTEIDVKIKIDFLTNHQKQDPKKQTYIEYYKGKQAIEDRLHPQDASKEINKLCFNIYKKIVNTASWFLFGESPKLINRSDNNDLFNLFKKSYDNAKTDTINDKIGRETFAYGESAELLYRKGSEVKYQFLSAKSNKFWPIFDVYGDLVVFVRSYEITDYDIESTKNVTVTYFEVYADTEMRKYKCVDNTYTEVFSENNAAFLTYNKMPIVYYKLDEPLPWVVKDLLDRFNKIASTHGDVNDYFAFPYLKLIGFPVGTKRGTSDEEQTDNDYDYKPQKNTPNVIQVDNVDEEGRPVKADADYLVWSTKPESAIYEIENLYKMALYLTSTPDLNFDNLKGLGNVSGIALKLMFTDAIAQSKSLKNIFFSLSRRINIHKQILTETTLGKDFTKLDIGIEFKNPIPDNNVELIENLVKSKSAGILSTETAVKYSPYVDNQKTEISLIDKDIEKQNAGMSAESLIL